MTFVWRHHVELKLEKHSYDRFFNMKEPLTAYILLSCQFSSTLASISKRQILWNVVSNQSSSIDPTKSRSHLPNDVVVVLNMCNTPIHETFHVCVVILWFPVEFRPAYEGRNRVIFVVFPWLFLMHTHTFTRWRNTWVYTTTTGTAIFSSLSIDPTSSPQITDNYNHRTWRDPSNNECQKRSFLTQLKCSDIEISCTKVNRRIVR